MNKHSIILQSEVGSTAWGLSLDPKNSDSDQMGVCIEGIEDVLDLNSAFEQEVSRTAEQRTGKVDAKSEPGDVDLTVYSLRKYLRLALKGNPTVLSLLYAPQSVWISGDSRGRQLQELAPHIVSRQAGKAFLGYLQAQRMRLLGEIGGLHGRLDTEEVRRVGYEGKFAMHMLRLGFQGIELLSTGRISMPTQEEARLFLLGVRRGESTKQDVLTRAGELEAELKDLLLTSPLPAEPNREAVERWMLDTYWQTWKSRYGNPSHWLYTGLTPEKNTEWLEATVETTR